MSERETIYVVEWARYPSDPISSKTFTSKADAEEFLNNKLEYYRYTTGEAWMKEI